ncbi:MAG TPA: glycine cleavage system protein GcvH [Bacteroidetes bacterium]|nr:glycine cleavage system protein GcvH [Bacteroidota bacterium]
MAEIPQELKYTEDHEWVRVEDDIVTFGITDYAQGELGDVVFLELPDVGDEVTQGEAFGSIEAVKTVADLFAPISGAVTEVNGALEDDPAVVNRDPYGEGWLIKVKAADLTQLDGLMDAEAYAEHIA